MKKVTLVLMVLTIISKLFGFTRDIILSYYYGASNISDVYLISLTIPVVIFSFVGVGISTGYIPMYSKILKNSGECESNDYTNKLINILIVICTIIVICTLIFVESIVKLFASGFVGKTFELAVQFTRISILGIYFTGLVYIFSSFLQLKEKYYIAALIGFPLNLITIISIILSSNKNIILLPVGCIIAAMSQLILLIPYIYKNGYRYKLIFDYKDKNIINMLYIALPIIAGTSINQINVLVDKTIASQIAIGGISALNYANKLNLFIQGIFVMSITSVLFPRISKMVAEKNIKDLKKSIAEAINSINLLVIPATVGAMIFTRPIIMLLFGRGAFDIHAISMTTSALFFYSIGMIGYALREVLSKAFYSFQDTKTPMINAIISLIINITLNIILSRYLGIGGLALATSISALFCTGLLFISLQRKIGSFGGKNIIISFIKILFSSIIMGLIALISFRFLLVGISQNLALIVSIGIGGFVYFILIYLMKIEDINTIVNNIKRKVKDI